ncbi:MAG: PAS domain S-box protein [Gammaproteobacteria bacterium]|nr:PAS domain S-box protein [Gammaproteobacteria bacterium]
MVTLATVHTSLHNKSIRIDEQLVNQSARQDIGVSIYQRLFAIKAFVLKLSMLDDVLELQIVKRRFDANLQVVKNGLVVLHDGGVFEDEIATNLLGHNFMHMTVHYNKPQHEGYVLEVLELGPAIHKLDDQVQLLYEFTESRITAEGPQQQLKVRIQNLLKEIGTVLQRTQENTAGILHNSQQKIELLSLQLKQAEQFHDNVRLPVIVAALCLATYSLFITLVRVRRIREQREQAQEQFHLLLDATVEGIYGVDLDGNTTFVNPAASRMLGFSPEELIGRENHMLIHHTRSDGTHYSAAECRILDVLSGGVIQTVDDELFWHKDGSSFSVEYSSTPIHRDGEIVGAVVSFRDISDRIRTEKQVRTMSQALEQSPVSVIMTNIGADIEYVNSAFEQSTGYSAAEVIGQNPRVLKSGKTPASHYQELWKALLAGKSWQGELQNCKKNGDVFWERAYIAPVLNESGEATHYLAVKEDITVQKQQGEQTLPAKESEAKAGRPR